MNINQNWKAAYFNLLAGSTEAMIIHCNAPPHPLLHILIRLLFPIMLFMSIH